MPAPEQPDSTCSRSRLWWERFLRWAPWVVPCLYLVLVFLIQPWDHFGARPGFGWAHLALYDDHDETAMALRGLNAHLGRKPGFVPPPENLDEKDYAEGLLENPPLKERFWLEYPHAALALFRLPYALQSPLPPVPPALLDGDYINLAYHLPQNATEQEIYYHLRWATRFYLCSMLLCFLGLMAVLRIGYEPGGGMEGPALLLLMLPALVYFSINRFDIVPALMTALSLAFLGRRWYAASAACLAAGAMVKVAPILLAPLIVRYLWPRWREALRWCLAFGVTALLIALPALLQGWEAFAAPYQFQLSREPELGQGHFYGVIFPWSLAGKDLASQAFRLGSVMVVELLVFWGPIPDLPRLLRRGALVFLVFISMPVFYSQQWIVWLAPLLLPLCRPPALQRPLFYLIVALDTLTFLTFPIGLLHEPALVILRFVLLLAIAAVLIRAEWLAKGRLAGEGRPSLTYGL